MVPGQYQLGIHPQNHGRRQRTLSGACRSALGGTETVWERRPQAEPRSEPRFWERKKGEIRETLMNRGRRRHLVEGEQVAIYRPRKDVLASE